MWGRTVALGKSYGEPNVTCVALSTVVTLSIDLPQNASQKHMLRPDAQLCRSCSYVGWFHSGVLVPELKLYDRYF